MDFLQIAGKKFVVAGVANKKSVAWHIAQGLKANGAEVIYTVRSTARKEQLTKLVGEASIYVCDVEHPEQIAALTETLRNHGHTLIHGLVPPSHSRIIQKVSARFTKPLLSNSCNRLTSHASR
jgi:enoyl-[acyl-carrier protein] reductase I